MFERVWTGFEVPNGRFGKPQPLKYHQNGSNNRSQSDKESSLITSRMRFWNESMKSRGCVADAFLKDFGPPLGCQIVDLGSRNHQDTIKMVPKSTKAKLDRGCVIGTFFGGPRAAKAQRTDSSLDHSMRQFRPKIGKKMLPERYSKLERKKNIKRMPKASDKVSKLMPYVDDFHAFSEKA